MTNHFDSKGGKQVNVTQTVRGDSNIVSGTGNVTVSYGIPPAFFAEYAGKLAVTDSALASFFKILEEQQVPLGDLDAKLREIAKQYKELLHRLDPVQYEDPQVKRLKQAAHQAIEQGRFADAASLLKVHIQGDTFNSGGGQQIIAQGTGAIGKQVNTYNIMQQQGPVDDIQELLKLVTEIKARLPEKVDARN
jgi:TolA-binding protein